MRNTYTSHANSVKSCWQIKQIENSYVNAEQKGSSLRDKPLVIMKAETPQYQYYAKLNAKQQRRRNQHNAEKYLLSTLGKSLRK